MSDEVSIDKTQSEEQKRFSQLLDKQSGRINAELDRHLPGSLNQEMLLLKGHLLAEYYLSILLVLHDEDPGVLTESFFTKLNKCESKKLLSKPVTGSLKKMNDLRNRMSHELEYSISESDIDSIGMPYGKEYVIQKLENQGDRRELLEWVLTRTLYRVNGQIVLKLDSESKK